MMYTVRQINQDIYFVGSFILLSALHLIYEHSIITISSEILGAFFSCCLFVVLFAWF